MRVLDLFAGIGGFSLGLERAGFTVVGQCEIDPFCRRVLANRWPDVWRDDDVRTLTGELVRRHCGRIDVVCGGVPCQPASVAGKRKGESDERWLWPDFLRVVRETEPLWVLAENVRGFVSLKPRGLDWCAGELAALGYECEAYIVGASHAGAPHRRERVWIVGRLADTDRHGIGHKPGCVCGETRTVSTGRRLGRRR